MKCSATVREKIGIPNLQSAHRHHSIFNRILNAFGFRGYLFAFSSLLITSVYDMLQEMAHKSTHKAGNGLHKGLKSESNYTAQMPAVSDFKIPSGLFLSCVKICNIVCTRPSLYETCHFV